MKDLEEDDYKGGSNLNEYIASLVNQRRLKKSTLNDYLFEELFYGQQKDVYVEKIYTFNSDILSKSKLDSIISKKYDGNSNFNRIATTLLSNEDERLELVACNISHNRETSEVNNIKMIFAYKVQIYNNKKVMIEEHSYVPIEVDLVRKIIISKVSPKTNVFKDEYKPETLYDKYSNIVKKLFEIKIESYNTKHKIALYNMSEALYTQFYNKMVLSRSEDLGKSIKDFSTEVSKKVNIKDMDVKIKKNNIFNIEESIKKYCDQLLITDILSSRNFKSEDMTDIEGIVTYLRFSDGTNVSAKVKGENFKASIYASETYLALRDPIENSNKVSEINIIWILENRDLRVKYNTNSYDYVFMHFYRDFKEKDFNYGYRKYKEYEQMAISKVRRMAK
ncbi:putative amino acid-binding ACT domain protein [Hathewaya limosa]|uniref:Amino acid-binding ACT domain protein n=1 Tax=Hathewaya limosa TaxID=1536 RepID=A0ABU0JNK7_HATLI|nr:putative amino acid-binding ACT domain protein [Hathewaya limosa]